MNVLALEPYYGGSHRAFLDGWIAHSRHDWTVLSLPARKWKWRMRHAAIEFARQVESLGAEDTPEVVFSSDMLNLAEFLGLAPRPVRDLPTVAYFHENQLTYPARFPDERDYQYCFTNITTALAATRVWFNSAFHRDEFLQAARELLRRMPDFQPLEAIDRIAEKSSVQHPGIDAFPPRGPREPGPLRVLWVARWEHDKNPECFFSGMRRLKSAGVEFRLSVLGESFRDSPAVFRTAREEFAEHIDHWGFLPSREAYRAALLQADVVVSTANHEFFGLAVAEAIAAGARPLAPRRLAYPELLQPLGAEAEAFLYDGSADELAARLTEWSRLEDVRQSAESARGAIARFHWPPRAAAMDAALPRSV